MRRLALVFCLMSTVVLGGSTLLPATSAVADPFIQLPIPLHVGPLCC